MKITNAGRGIHVREIKGVDRFRADLPPNWYGFTNLDFVLDAGTAREVDIVIVSDLRIFLVDIKDWHGVISSVDGRWHQDGVDKDSSPVTKVTEIARRLAPLLAKELRKHQETRGLPIPKIEGLVVLTARANTTGIAETERAKVLTADEFIGIVKDSRRAFTSFGPVAREFVDRGLTDPFWKGRLTPFFNAGPASPFKPGKRRFERFTADDAASFTHPKSVYAEYDATEEGNPNNLGTLRLWDFGNCDTKFQTEEGRLEIAGREKQVYHWLRDRSDDIENILLGPKLDDRDRGVNYWEIYDRRRRLQRLGQFSGTEAKRLLPADRIELARQMLSAVASMHRQNAAHLDLGAHSIWVESPTTVKLSHLLASRFPEVKSLGEARYQFLASVGVPEDVLGYKSSPKSRDAYLIGVAVHQLLFGAIPAGTPPEWDAAVDAGEEFAPLHNWLAAALDMSPDDRFGDAVIALEAFNKATAARPTFAEVTAGLERLRAEVRTQRQLSLAYPMVGDPIVENDRLEVWCSGQGADKKIVKLWKQAAWGDLKREGATILAFLERAKNMKADRPSGLPTVLDVIWLGDAFAVVQSWVHGKSIADTLQSLPEALRTPLGALKLLKQILSVIDSLHEQQIGHGDLKPENIVVEETGSVVLIDALDFSPRSDGALVSSAYAPQSGNIFERDRFAATKIADELLLNAGLEDQDAAKLSKAIKQCQEKEPILSTLSPVLDEIDAIIERLETPISFDADQLSTPIAISIKDASLGIIEPDEGSLFLRFRRHTEYNTLYFVIRGATEEVEVRLTQDGEPRNASRRLFEQRFIKRSIASEFHQISSKLNIVRNGSTDLEGIQVILNLPIVQQHLKEALSGAVGAAPTEADDDEAEPERLSEEEQEEQLTEEVAASLDTSAALTVDVPRLWRSLVDVENELTIEGIAQLDSSYDRNTSLHRLPLELESGEFEFAKNDTVGVERQDKRGHWRRIGELDVLLSKPHLAFINTSEVSARYQGRLVEEGQRLKFISHFESQSLKRRTDAVDRILAGNGRSRDLLSVFDARTELSATRNSHKVDPKLLALYDLNEDQNQAFERIVACRPVGLLQGPPGTGKTRFIGALAHYALTNGLAKNVLISSQSHEAVNTAAEAVLSLFRKTGEQPSLLRVAWDEELVSPPLRAFHTPKVEKALKDRFKASFSERLSVAGEALGLPESIISDVISLETDVRPIVARLAELSGDIERDEQRVTGLINTLETHVKALGLSSLDTDEEPDWSNFAETIAHDLMERHRTVNGISGDLISKIRDAAVVGRDFSASVSRAQRSFEGFLAGTRQIVVGTCVGLGRTSLGLTNTAFDLVIVDEAARCTASELLVPLQAARWAVLVGDHAQLQPNHKPEVVNQVTKRTGIPKAEIVRSDFERVFSTGYGKNAGARLKTQYRMWPAIGAIVSESFYPDLVLEAGRSQPEIDPAILPETLGKPLTWVETDSLGEQGFEKRDNDKKSLVNRTEAAAIQTLIEDWHSNDEFREWLETQQKHPAGIGIICMYSAQRDLIRTRLRQSSIAYLLDKHVKVGTVDSYQGKENPIVLLSLVRNNEAGILQGGTRCIHEGFLISPNRINVAASRAMDRLVIVGARHRWASTGPMGRLVASVARQEAAGNSTAIDVKQLLPHDTASTPGGSAKVKAKSGGKPAPNGGPNG